MITPIEDFCTLPAAAQPLRLMEFDELFRSQVRPPQQIDARPVEFTFAGAEGLHAKVSDLVARESTCCSFFEFTIDEHAQACLITITSCCGSACQRAATTSSRR